jgi:zinc protease
VSAVRLMPMLVVAALAAAPLHAQVRTRPARPAPPAPAPVAALAPTEAAAPGDTGTSDFTVGGVRVILRRNTANDVIAANLYLLGGVRMTTDSTAGIEPFLFLVSEQGTKKYPKDKLRKAMARLGTSIGADADQDWTEIGIRATRPTLDSTWAVFADRLMQPLLDSTEVERVRTQLLSAVRQRRDDPDALVHFLADSVAYEGHPYGRSESGTERSIGRITRAELRAFARDQLVTSRMLLVVVGNVTRAQVERLVLGSLAQLPRGSYAWTLPDTLPTMKPAITIEARQLPTNYLLGYVAGPPPTSKDYQALRIAASVLSGQLDGELRQRRNLTYAVNAPFREGGVSSAGLYITTIAPNTALDVMRREIQLLQRELLNPEALAELVQQFLVRWYRTNETNAEQATGLARAHLYNGDWRAADRFIEDLRQVTPVDVQRAAKTYFKNVRFAYVGDPSKIARTAATRF